MVKGKPDVVVFSSDSEKDKQNHLVDLFKTTSIGDDEILANLGLFLTSKNFARLLFYYEIYQKIVGIHGQLFEFGVRWGQTLTLLSTLRGIMEPFNRHRKIVGFDTFEGFAGLNEKDGKRNDLRNGSYSVTLGYEEYLEDLLSTQEQLNPIGHIKKFELVKGDVVQTAPNYLAQHPETIIALAVFDLDIYAPTKAAIEAVRPHLCKGSILVFDELGDETFPGETVALNEVLGIRNVRIQRLPMTSRISFIEVE